MRNDASPPIRNLGGRPRRAVAVEKVEQLRKQGLSYRQIARRMRLGYGTVRRAYLASRVVGTAAAD